MFPTKKYQFYFVVHIFVLDLHFNSSSKMSLILRTLRTGGLINKNSFLKLSQSQRTLFGNKFDAAGKGAKREETEKEATEETTTTPPPSAEQAENTCEKTAEIERLTAEIEKLQAEKIEADQKNKLQLADLINTEKLKQTVKNTPTIIFLPYF